MPKEGVSSFVGAVFLARAILYLMSRRNKKFGDSIEIRILDIKGQQARIGIMAPKKMPVHREEIYKRIQADDLTNPDLSAPSG